MGHDLQPLGGERAVRATCVNSEVSVNTAGQVYQIGSVLKLTGEVKDRPKLFREGLVLEKVRIFEEAEQKRPL